MVGSVGSFVNYSPTPGAPARAVRPAADAPSFRDRRRRQAAQHAAAAVTLAPAAMSALIEAQERLGQAAPPMGIGRLCGELDGAQGFARAKGATGLLA